MSNVRNNIVVDAGFTLLETLIALAIMSIVSLALFQSLGQMLAVSDRAVRLTNESFDHYADEAAFRDFIGDIIGTWVDADPHVLKGDGQSLSGLAVSPLIVERLTGAQPFRLTLESLPSKVGQRSQFQLVLDSDGLLENAVGERPRPVIAIFEGQNPRFTYHSFDRTARSNWPPQQVPSPGILNDDKFMDVPRLPHVVMLEYEYNGQNITLAAPTRHQKTLSQEFGRNGL